MFEELVRLPAADLATRLIGWRLVRIDDGERIAVEIHETEAYPGGSDRASHSFDGRRTPRNESMWRQGGHLYVFFVYGMHHCCNIVSGADGAGEAVLLRAGRPLEGVARMRALRTPTCRERDLCRGPGRLAAALGIDLSFDGYDLRHKGMIRLEPPLCGDVKPIRCGPRVGIDFSGRWAQRRRLRFGLQGSCWLSRPPIEGPLVRIEGLLAQEIESSR